MYGIFLVMAGYFLRFYEESLFSALCVADFLLSIHSVNWPISERTAGMIKIAPIRENPTAIRVEIPKLLIMGKRGETERREPEESGKPGYSDRGANPVYALLDSGDRVM